jgi:hypothetical protein
VLYIVDSMISHILFNEQTLNIEISNFDIFSSSMCPSDHMIASLRIFHSFVHARLRSPLGTVRIRRVAIILD